MKYEKTALQIMMFAVLLASAPVGALADESDANESYLDANTKSTGYIGVLMGANIPAGNYGSDNSSGFGLTLGGKIAPNLGLGFYGTYYGQNNSGSAFGLPVGTSSNSYNLAGEVNGLFSILHAGVDLGAGIHSWSGTAGNLAVGNSNTSMIYGPEAGIDIPLSSGASHLSLGAEIHYLFTNATNGQSNLQALAALKVWM